MTWESGSGIDEIPQEPVTVRQVLHIQSWRSYGSSEFGRSIWRLNEAQAQVVVIGVVAIVDSYLVGDCL